MSLDFFDDILIPPSHLFQPTTFSPPSANEAKPVWVWHNDGSDYYFDANEKVRWRVEEEFWRDQAPDGPAFDNWNQGRGVAGVGSGATGATGGASNGRASGGLERGASNAARGIERMDEEGAGMGIEERERVKELRCPYRLIGSMSQPGLGPVEWWDEQEG